MKLVFLLFAVSMMLTSSGVLAAPYDLAGSSNLAEPQDSRHEFAQMPRSKRATCSFSFSLKSSNEVIMLSELSKIVEKASWCPSVALWSSSRLIITSLCLKVGNRREAGDRGVHAGPTAYVSLGRN